jgi:hypothetical protein
MLSPAAVLTPLCPDVRPAREIAAQAISIDYAGAASESEDWASKHPAQGECMKMYPNDWPVRLCGAAGAMVGGTVGLFVVKPLIELPVWLGPLAFVALIGLGGILGNIVGVRLFHPSTDKPKDHSPHT